MKNEYEVKLYYNDQLPVVRSKPRSVGLLKVEHRKRKGSQGLRRGHSPVYPSSLPCLPRILWGRGVGVILTDRGEAQYKTTPLGEESVWTYDSVERSVDGGRRSRVILPVKTTVHSVETETHLCHGRSNSESLFRSYRPLRLYPGTSGELPET